MLHLLHSQLIFCYSNCWPGTKMKNVATLYNKKVQIEGSKAYDRRPLQHGRHYKCDESSWARFPGGITLHTSKQVYLRCRRRCSRSAQRAPNAAMNAPVPGRRPSAGEGAPNSATNSGSHTVSLHATHRMSLLTHASAARSRACKPRQPGGSSLSMHIHCRRG